MLLLREAAVGLNLFPRLAGCFTDKRDQRRIEHTVEELLAQRIMGIACGYEDLNDHDHLRRDPMFAVAAGKRDPSGQTRRHERDKGCALAGHATLNRIETAPSDSDAKRRDHRIFHQPEALERLFVDLFLDAHDEPPAEIVLDFDATDDTIHGNQEGRFFHGYYKSYCYLPLYVFCGDFLLVAKLRKADRDGASEALNELKRIVQIIRARWPETNIVVRADSGFCRDELMVWCEAETGVDFVIGLARNTRLVEQVEPELETLEQAVAKTGEAHREFKELQYRTLKSWSKTRRVVAKAEVLTGKRNPRFVVTSLTKKAVAARELYEDVYCARGDMENRIKEQQLGLFADRTSSHTMRANQLRLWFSSFAYVLMNELRRVGLTGTTMARAQVWTIRERLLKVGGQITQSVRRIRLWLSSGSPVQGLFAEVLARLRPSNAVAPF